MVKQRANSFNTGIAAEYFVLSQLFRLDFEAYLSQGNKKAIDIRIILKNEKAISIDVKSVRGYSSLVVNNVKAKDNHFIIFVIFNNNFEDLQTFPDVYIVPSKEVESITKPFKNEKRVMKTPLLPYRNRWDLLNTYN
jgi:hypothetical protein